MKLRLALVASLTAVAISALALAPAEAAAPSAPVVSNLDASTPGHVTGTVTSDQPFVLVRMPYLTWTVLPVSGGTATFDLETWGYASTQTLQAVACSQDTYSSASCSGLQTDGVLFTPTDVVPQITWPDDPTIGPAQTATVTVADPDGGGYLAAELVKFGYPPVVTPLDRNGTTQLNLAEGGGWLRVRRCATPSRDICASFTPEQRVYLNVHTVARATLQGLQTITGASPVAHPTVDTDRVGTYSLSWHLERDGVPVPGRGATVTGTLSTYGETAPLSVDGDGLPDGEYTLVTATTVTEPEYGTFPAATASLPVVIDVNPPSVASIGSSVGLIYPMAGDTPGHPRSTTITAEGTFGPADHFIITNNDPSGSSVRLPLDTTVSEDGTELRATWNGTPEGTFGVLRGTYAVSVVDGFGNVSPTTAVIAVSNLTLVHKTYRVWFAPTFMVAKHVGRCSTLRRLVPPQRSGALGYYANTRCNRAGPRASSVFTEHRLKLPAAYRYTDVRVNTEGGAARSRPTSQAVFRFRSASGGWVGAATLPSSYGVHTGATHDLTGLVRTGGILNWSVAASTRNRYVVRRFIATVHYDVLEEPLWRGTS